MAGIKVICDRSDIVAIADAVRNKTNTTNEMTLDNIATNINKIATSGGVVLPTLINEGSASDMLSGKELIDSDGNIVTGTISTKNSNDLTVSGATVSVPAGYYAKSTTKNVSTATQAAPTIEVNANGLITATSIQTSGYVDAGTKSSTKQLSIQSAKTITPTTTSQIAISGGVYATGDITVSGDLNLVANNIKSGVSIFGVTGNYSETGFTPTGNLDITQNGSYDVYKYASANVDVPIPDGYIVPSGTQEITVNGTYDVTDKESVVVDVPERQLVLQEFEITENGTYVASSNYDAIGRVIVNVTGGGSTTDTRDQYQRVEYITSAEEGTYPYIITDICANNSTGVEIVASFPILQDKIPMGSRQDSSTTRFYCVYPMSASSIYYGFNTGSPVSCALKVDTIYRCQTNFLNSRLVNVYDEDGIRKGGASLSATLTPHTVPISIFGYNSGSSGAVSSKREYKLYSARISLGHEVIREYIPCYRKSDGVVGLYEKFTETFLTSETDAVFTKGADIEW